MYTIFFYTPYLMLIILYFFFLSFFLLLLVISNSIIHILPSSDRRTVCNYPLEVSINLYPYPVCYVHPILGLVHSTLFFVILLCSMSLSVFNGSSIVTASSSSSYVTKYTLSPMIVPMLFVVDT
jgi:hypothetical protein